MQSSQSVDWTGFFNALGTETARQRQLALTTAAAPMQQAATVAQMPVAPTAQMPQTPSFQMVAASPTGPVVSVHHHSWFSSNKWRTMFVFIVPAISLILLIMLIVVIVLAVRLRNKNQEDTTTAL
jgi:endonuclease/exonuclease/phosphatase (EEP) superfamily protein YafD